MSHVILRLTNQQVGSKRHGKGLMVDLNNFDQPSLPLLLALVVCMRLTADPPFLRSQCWTNCQDVVPSLGRHPVLTGQDGAHKLSYFMPEYTSG